MISVIISNCPSPNFSLLTIRVSFLIYNKLESIINNVIEERDKRKSSLKIGINSVINGFLTDKESKQNINNVNDAWKKKVNFISFEPLMGLKVVERTQPCRTLWRNLVVGWDGTVYPCCTDMAGELKLGNVNDTPLKKIFNDQIVKRIRKGLKPLGPLKKN